MGRWVNGSVVGGFNKTLAKGELRLKGLASTVQIFSKDIVMEFGKNKCGVLVLKRRKVLSSEGAEMLDGESESIKEV